MENNNPERKYKDGEFVLAGHLKLKMIIIKATLCLAGWRYELAFCKKDGTPDKRRKRDHWSFFEKDLSPIIKQQSNETDPASKSKDQGRLSAIKKRPGFLYTVKKAL